MSRQQSHVFTRQPLVEMPTVARGEGCYLIDQSGKRYLDGSGGAAVSCLGHSDTAVVDAIKTQLDTVAFAHTGFFTSPPAEALADLLAQHAPGDINHCYFVSGGSEAIEAAIKMARQFHIENNEPARSRLIARQQSYHGNTLGALAAGGNRGRRLPFEPLLADVSHIAPCYPYRYQAEGETEQEYGRRAAQALEEEILRLGPETVLAFIAEPVVGATAGALVAPTGYFRRIREICDTYGVLLILDEVMCGMGRTGSLFACSQEDVVPDIVAIAKGLGAGYQPIGATLCRRIIYDTIVGGSGFFQHGHTYMGHPTACAAGLAVVTAMLDRALLPQVVERGRYLQQALVMRLGQHSFVGDIRGRGLFWAIELVADRERKTPFDPGLRLAQRIKQTAFERGLICYPASGTADGQMGDHILLAPPFIVSESQLDSLADIIAATIEEETALALSAA